MVDPGRPHDHIMLRRNDALCMLDNSDKTYRDMLIILNTYCLISDQFTSDLSMCFTAARNKTEKLLIELAVIATCSAKLRVKMAASKRTFCCLTAALIRNV
jgi:hypothetical protein